ncbi:MAG: efflux RND transporter periplasmic adaptor subunit [Bacteroidales bacterium]|nr:efflux RND transporter periplasmic adaptor subunit [Bacteroidales bacterium]
MKTSDLNLSTNYSATIQGQQEIAVNPEVSGKITSVNIKEGDKVHKGQILFVIDQVPYQAAYNSALANVEAAKVSVASAQLDYDSNVTLYENNVISNFELTQSLNSLSSAKAALAQAEASLVTAENNLSYTEVKSPVDGVAGTIPYRVGALVSSANTLTTVADNSLMYVYFSIGENAALSLAKEYGSMDAAIKEMPDVYLKLSDGSLYSESGRVASVSGVINASTGAVQVRAEFTNPNKLLMSGANGTIMFPDLYRDEIIIPQEATYQLQDKFFVYKVIDGVTQSSEITVNPKNDGATYIVTSGLEVGDKIVAEGAGLLRSGVPVIERLVNLDGTPVAGSAAQEPVVEEAARTEETAAEATEE